ncbi:PepSY-associated TM helix domain-containing protein [Pseudothauera rhizosphaerae]|uniref:PepSY domain-containing protein n=1 Tax=Pseudothauera rhizosphaerae TaxID=2565932 RepID=A0A4S4AYB5_9RHOO|nr:PepSY-associated TM helix domain-containing protein [Pseudothauera rhizosphaerae]THF65107.1 PepSY domain-containing protein [Pseudothauera rhizosphaerae]
MRSDFIRIYKTVHTWTGIVAGMALFIAFYAGALTIFKEPLSRWVAPPSAASTASAAMALDEVPILIQRTLAAHPEAARDFRVNLQPAEHLPPLNWQVRPQGADDHDTSGVRHYVATLAADGSAQVEEVHPSRLAEFIDTLHRVVGLPVDSDPNRWIMGVIASLYAVALVSGVIVLLPSLVKDFFALRVGRNVKRMWLDAHNVVGIISLPFHVVMALTSVVFAFHDQIYDLQDKFLHGGALTAAFRVGGAGPAPGAAPRDPAALLPPAELLARVRALSPGFEPTSLQYLNVTEPRAGLRVWGHDPAAHSPRFIGGFVGVDPYSGKIVNTDFMPGRQDAANATVSSFFALHFGTYGGTPVQWMYFLLGLAGAWLFYGGNLLWVETRRIKASRGAAPAPDGARPVQRRDVRLMAAATVGVCLGCVCGISLTIAAGKWLPGQLADPNTWHPIIYYAAFFAAIAWAFLRGAARAAVHLLWLAAACTLAIPATSLLGWLVPGLGLWAHASALGVDLTALAGALGFIWLARATARRVQDGPADSVWSAPAPARQE